MANSVMVNKKIKNYVELFSLGLEDEVLTVRLTDIDESFFFEDVVKLQLFMNAQATERVGDKELRKGYFDYEDEHGEIHRYHILEVRNGRICSFKEEVITA